MIKYKGKSGEFLDLAIKRAIAKAVELNTRVKITFNGTSVVFNKFSNERDVLSLWFKKRK